MWQYVCLRAKRSCSTAAWMANSRLQLTSLSALCFFSGALEYPQTQSPCGLGILFAHQALSRNSICRITEAEQESRSLHSRQRQPLHQIVSTCHTSDGHQIDYRCHHSGLRMNFVDCHYLHIEELLCQRDQLLIQVFLYLVRGCRSRPAVLMMASWRSCFQA